MSPVPGSAPTSRRGLLLLLALLWVIWGTNWALIPIALREVSVWGFRTVSCAGAGLALLALARWRGLSLVIPRAQWPTVAVATLFYLVLWNVASAFAAVLIPSGQAAVLGFTMPLWAALIGWAVLGQRLAARTWATLGLGGAAVALLAWRGMPAYAQAPLGVALAVAAAIGWAVGTLILQRSAVSVPALVLTGWQLLGTGLAIGAVTLALGLTRPNGPAALPSGGAMLVIAWMTLVPMAVGNWVWFIIVGRLPAHVAGLSSIMVPVVAMVTGAVVHGEPLGPVQLSAMACCGAALWLALQAPPATAPGSGQR